MTNWIKQSVTRSLYIALIAILIAAIAGCAAKRDNYNVPALILPGEYAQNPTSAEVDQFKNSPEPTPPTSLAPVLASPFSVALEEWWRLLGSSELNQLMDRALANNPDLRIATLRIAQSKARIDQAEAGFFPTISLPIQSSSSFPAYGPGSAISGQPSTSRTTNQFSLKGEWRPDIWGESASLYESAEMQLLRATFQRDDMQRTVAAKLVEAYLEYLSLNDRLRVARATERSLNEMLVSVNARLKIGDATLTEMEQQKAAVYSVKSTIPVLGQQRELVLNRIATLLGSVPVELKLSHSGLNSITYPMVLPGMPAALLLRRPDVRAIESRMLSADADIDVARARILPPLDLSSQVGLGGVFFPQLFNSTALFANLVASLSVSIFDHGKKSNEVKFAQAMHEELLETYIRIINDSVREVDDSLSTIRFMGSRLESQTAAVDASLRAFNYSQEAFSAGAVDYLVLLDTQRSYQRNLDEMYNVQLERFRGLVNLFSALGGGVPASDPLPGEGARPTALADELDYGALLSRVGMQSGTEASGEPPAHTNATGLAGLNGFHRGRLFKDSLLLSYNVTLSDKAQSEKLDWDGASLRDKANDWLVELPGVYDRGAVLPAWRDMQARFPLQLENHNLLPHRQGEVMSEGKERVSWYRLYIASFTDKKTADNYCAELTRAQQRCGVVNVESLSGNGSFAKPAEKQPKEKSAAKDEALIPSSGLTAALIKQANEEGSPTQLELLTSETIALFASAPQAKPQDTGVDWFDQQFWLVELSEAYERNAMAGAWRNLLKRFPEQLKNRTIVPRRQAVVQQPTAVSIAQNTTNMVPLYQLFIARFSLKLEAETFCEMLRAEQQRCTVVSSKAVAEKAASNLSPSSLKVDSRSDVKGGSHE
ncbi:MAG: TolC family protein [Gallionellaceae bacterium]